jgi:hypothetical protein
MRVVGMGATTVAAGIVFLGARQLSLHVREVGSAGLATISGLLWAASALPPSDSPLARILNVAAAALATLSGVLLLP